MAEWSNAAVLKTVDVKASGGSNPSLSAEMQLSAKRWAVFIFPQPSLLERGKKYKTAIVCHRHTSCNNSARALRRVLRECTARRASPIPHYQSQLEVLIIINGVRRYVHLDRKVKAADFNVFHCSVVVSVRGQT